MSVKGEILKLVKERGEIRLREGQNALGRQWYTIYWHVKDPKNERNLLKLGCLVEERIVAETENRAQDMYVYRPGPRFDECLKMYAEDWAED